MAEPQPYQWDYDRSPVDDGGEYGFRTFSVGVFQWLPKASGRGLKKSTRIRVCGYTADAQSVYDKAEELCQEFNAACVRHDNLPKWMQKQYSVSRPASVEPKRPEGRLTTSQIRSVRTDIMKDYLFPQGFIASKGEGATYVRRRGNQIHLINFQGCGQGFYVNLGFHFTHIPPLFRGKTIALDQFHQLDCGLRSRLGSLMANPTHICVEYSNSRITFRAAMVRCAEAILDRFEVLEKKWSDPATVLAQLEVQRTNPWWAHHREMVRASVLLWLGRFDDAETALRQTEEPWRITGYEMMPGIIASLRAKLPANVPVQVNELPDFIIK